MRWNDVACNDVWCYTISSRQAKYEYTAWAQADIALMSYLLLVVGRMSSANQAALLRLHAPRSA